MEVRVEIPETQRVYYPNHLTHGLLDKHCLTIRSLINDSSAMQVNVGDPVEFSEDDSLHRLFNEAGAKGFTLSNYMDGWKVVNIQNEVETGYFGVIYVNDNLKQLVLVHGSTDFKISLTRKLLTQSGLHQGIEGVFLGRILLHQAHGFVATERAVRLVKSVYKDYTLSFSGHSLGAWLAELSVFYCHDTFKYKYVRAVSFDGPGSRKMMEKMKEGDLDRNRLKLEHLDIISYLSAPNIVNCTNKHVEKLYRLYPQNLAQNLMERLPEWCQDNEIASYLVNSKVALTTGGHFLDFILSSFDPDTGKPRIYDQVDKWPCIKSKCPENFKFKRETGLVRFLLPQGMNMIEEGVEVVVGEVCRMFNFNDSTLSSLCHLASILWQGEICYDQFFCVHSYLDPSRDLIACPQSSIDKFFLKYEAQYEVSQVKPWSRKATGSDVDECLNKLVQHQLNIQGEELIGMIHFIEYDISGHYEIKKEYRDYVTIDHVVDYIANLWYQNWEFRQFINNIDKKRLQSNLNNDSLSDIDIELITKHGLNCKILILRGIPVSYMNNLAKAYAKRFEREFTTIFVKGTIKADVDKTIQDCANSLTTNNKFNSYQNLYHHLCATKQKICFLLEDVKDKSVLSSLIFNFSDLNNVQFIITTKNDNISIDPHEKVIAVDEIPIYLEIQERKNIRTALNNLIKENYLGLSNPSLKEHLINSLAFLKSRMLSLEDLVNCLSSSQLEKEDVEKIVTKLRSESYLTIDDLGLVFIHPIVQSVAQEVIKYESPVLFLQLAFSFRHDTILTEYLFSKLLEYCKEKIGLITVESLKLHSDERRKCNIKSTVKCLLKEIKISKKEGEGVKTFELVLKTLQDFADKELQSKMTKLASGWSQTQTNEGEKLEFLESNKNDIATFLEMFNSFGKWVKENVIEKETSLEAKEHVLFLGPTGSTKSTIINNLIGNQLICTYAGNSFEKSELEVIPFESNKVAEIGNRDVSQTNTISAYFNKTTNVMYWDFPGFLDSHGEIQRIENAFGLQRFSEMVSYVKIVLVVGASTVYENRGDSFRNIIDLLGNLCGVDQLARNLSLLVTKYDPITDDNHRIRSKRRIIDQCKSNLEDNSFLTLFEDSDMINKLAFVSRIEKEGIVDDNIFQDFKSILTSVASSEIVFKMNVDDKTNTTVSKIGDLLNFYAANIFQTAANLRIAEVNSAIRQDYFTKDALRTIKTFSTSSDNLNFASQFADASVLNAIMETLNCCHHIVFSVKPDIETWVKPLTQFNDQYDYLRQEPNQKPNKKGLIRIEAPILSASDIAKIDLSGVNSIEAVSFMFICDKDLKLPGISLFLCCVELRVIGNRKFILKADGSTENKNAGSFYGYVEHVTKESGTISFDLNGMDGENGTFGSSDEISNQMSTLNAEIENMYSILQCIDKLKSYQVDTLAERVKRFEGEEKEYKESLTAIEREIFDIQIVEQLMNANSKSRELTDEKNMLTSQYERKRIDLENVREELTLVKKLQELTKIYSEYENSLTEPTESIESDEGMTIILTSSIRPIIEEIIDLDCILMRHQSCELHEGSLDKQSYKQLQDILLKVEDISVGLKDFKKKKGDGYCRWENYCRLTKNNVLEQHWISVSGFAFELNAQDYHEIVSDSDSDMEKGVKAVIEALNKKKYDMQNMVFDTEKSILDFEKQHLEQKKLKFERDKSLQEVETQREIMRAIFEDEFFEIENKINEITDAAENKEKAYNEWHSVVSKKDVIFPSNKKIFSKANREFLGNIDESAFSKHCEIQKQKLEKREKNAIGISLLCRYMLFKAILKLRHAKKICNDIAEECQLTDIVEFTFNDDETDLEKKYDSVCCDLRIWPHYDNIFSYFKRYFTSNDSLYEFVTKQYILQEDTEEKLEITKEYPESFDRLLKNVKDTEKEHLRAKQIFIDWEENQIGDQPEALTHFIQAYKKFLDCDQKFQDSFKEGVKVAGQCLLNNSNMTARKERYMNDRGFASKVGHVCRTLFTLNKQYYEKYEISGSEGKSGGNSGAFHFDVDKSFTKVRKSQYAGRGGEHSFILDGVYLNEYSFAQFRDLGGVTSDTNPIYNESTHVAIIPTMVFCLGDDILALLATQTATKSFLGLLSLAPTAAAMITSPLFAITNSGWVHGPCITYPGFAPKGKEQQIDQDLVQKCRENCKNYVESLSQKNLPFF